MKKIISFIAAFCMLVSMTVSAAVTTDSTITMTADKTTAQPGDVINFTVHVSKDSDGKGLQSASIAFYYDDSLIEFDTGSIVYNPTYATRKFETKSDSKGTYLQMQNSSSKANGGTYDVGAFDVFKFKGTVKAGATGTIEFTKKTCVAKITNYDKTSETKAVNTMTYPTITIQAAQPAVKPTITLNAANAGDGKVTGTEVSSTDSSVTYKVTVEKMPIGATAAYVVVNGDETDKKPVVNGVYEATYTANSTLTVAYDYDTTNVITYTEKYEDTDGVVVFGKAPTTASEYGFKLDGAWKTFNNGTDKIKADENGKFAASSNVNGVFAVKFAFNSKAEGTYTAYAYADDATAADGIVVYTAE